MVFDARVYFAIGRQCCGSRDFIGASLSGLVPARLDCLYGLGQSLSQRTLNFSQSHLSGASGHASCRTWKTTIPTHPQGYHHRHIMFMSGKCCGCSTCVVRLFPVMDLIYILRSEYKKAEDPADNERSHKPRPDHHVGSVPRCCYTRCVRARKSRDCNLQHSAFAT